MMVLRILMAMLMLSYGNVQAQTLRAGEAIEKIQHRYAAAPPPNTCYDCCFSNYVGSSAHLVILLNCAWSC
jgi:hypothetical protein